LPIESEGALALPHRGLAGAQPDEHPRISAVDEDMDLLGPTGLGNDGRCFVKFGTLIGRTDREKALEHE
jgi:hypothetical protein